MVHPWNRATWQYLIQIKMNIPYKHQLNFKECRDPKEPWPHLPRDACKRIFLVLMFVTRKSEKTEVRVSRGKTLKYNHTLYPTAAEMRELGLSGTSLVAQMIKNLPEMRKTQVQSLGWEDPLEKGMATHSSILTWRIPWREEPGEL